MLCLLHKDFPSYVCIQLVTHTRTYGRCTYTHGRERGGMDNREEEKETWRIHISKSTPQFP